MKFVTGEWNKVNDLSDGQYSVDKNIRSENPMLRSNLYEYRDVYIAVKGKMTVEGTNHVNESLTFQTWNRGVVVITTAQIHLIKPELRFCAGSSHVCGVSEIRDHEDLWQWFRLEIRLNAFRRSTIPQKQFFIIIIIIIIIRTMLYLDRAYQKLLHFRWQCKRSWYCYVHA